MGNKYLLRSILFVLSKFPLREGYTYCWFLFFYFSYQSLNICSISTDFDNVNFVIQFCFTCFYICCLIMTMTNKTGNKALWIYKKNYVSSRSLRFTKQYKLIPLLLPKGTKNLFELVNVRIKERILQGYLIKRN